MSKREAGKARVLSEELGKALMALALEVPESVHEHFSKIVFTEFKELHRQRDRARAIARETLRGWRDCTNYKGEYLRDKHGDLEDIAALEKELKEVCGE